ncbi:MAG: hypothetical protein ABI615_03780 [Chthoniobacterales bacterium]
MAKSPNSNPQPKAKAQVRAATPTATGQATAAPKAKPQAQAKAVVAAGKASVKTAASAAPAKKAAPAAPNDLVDQLRSLVQRNTRRWKALIIFQALGLALAIPLGYFLIVILLDNVIHMPTWGRVTACAILLAAVLGCFWWLLSQWRQARFTEDQVALAMEKQTPGVENRLINALQIAREGNQGNYSEAVIQENYQRLKRIQMQQAVKIRPAIIRMLIAGIIVCIGVGLWGFQRQPFMTAMKRIINPLAKITPIYRTVLTVEPGDVQCQPGGDVTVKVSIKGEMPSELVIFRSSGEMRSSETIGIEPKANSATYIFKNVQRSVSYSIKGGDFTSDTYLIDVPTPPQINLVRSSYHYPEYTKLPDQKIESAGGDMEALYGTKANLVFVLDQPADKATLLVEKVSTPAANVKKDGKDGKEATTTSSIERIEMKKSGTSEFAADIVFVDVLGYQIETQTGTQAVRKTVSYGLRVMADQAPSLTLTGIERKAEAQIGGSLNLKASAEDDYGLAQVALFYRKTSSASAEDTASPEGSPAPAAPTASPGATPAPKADADDWQQIIAWPAANSARQFQADYTLPIASLNATEGDQIEICLRAKDGDPLKNGQWTSGEAYTLLIGGEGVALQVLYEHILQSEADIKALIAAENQAIANTTPWNQKLDLSSGLRWDDKKNLDALGTAMREQAKAQEAMREKMGKTARNLVEQISNLRLPLGLLADTEVNRAVRILESVAGRETPQDMRTTLAEGRLTMERTIRSLTDILEQYTKFRKDWELANMTPFVKMLEDRQTALRDECTGYKDKAPAGASAALLQNSVTQRQNKLLQLSNLAQGAIKGVGERINTTDAFLGKAFIEASTAFDTSGLKTQMQQASAAATGGRWAEAVPSETKAAESLANIHFLLKKAAIDAAQRANATAKEALESKVAGQEAIKAGKSGPANPPMLEESSVQRLVATAEARKKLEEAKKQAEGKDAVANSRIEEYMKATFEKDNTERPDASKFRESTSPGAIVADVPRIDAVTGNFTPVVKIPDKLTDVVGTLLEESEKLTEEYQTLQANTNEVGQDTGAIGKLGGEANSFSSTAKTGDQKPPPQNSGGASGTGRQGGRAHGLVTENDAPNMRGRDTAQQGDEEIAEQAGMMNERKTADMQKDTSEGRGGKRVRSDDTQFTNNGYGEFKAEKDVDKMGPANKIEKRVEKQGPPMDPKVAAMMRDLKGSQEQMIQRVNALKKEFKNLFLPTDRLDEISNQLSRNMDRMKESPDEGFFRDQLQALDQLRKEMLVFNQAYSGNQTSVPRAQAVQGRILDEPPSQTTPGYENAVKNYFEKLGNQ